MDPYLKQPFTHTDLPAIAPQSASQFHVRTELSTTDKFHNASGKVFFIEVTPDSGVCYLLVFCRR